MLAYLAYADLGATRGGGAESLLIHDSLDKSGLLSAGLFREVTIPRQRAEAIFPGGRMGARAIAGAAKLGRRSPRLWTEMMLDRSFLRWADDKPIQDLFTSTVAPRARDLVHARGGTCIVFGKGSLGQAHILRRETEVWGFPADPGAVRYSSAYDDFVLSTDAVLTLAKRDIARLERRKDGRGPQALYVRNAIPRRTPIPRPKRPAGAPVRFLFLGTNVLGKGLLYLIDAWHMSEGPGELTVAGPGRRPRLRRFIRRRWPHLPRFTYHPFLDPERAYAEADALVLPTLAEGSPRTVLEAASRGLPIITTEVGAEGLPDTRQARMVSTGSTQELAQAITQLAESPDLRARLGRASRSAAESATQERFAQDVVGGVVKALSIRRSFDT